MDQETKSSLSPNEPDGLAVVLSYAVEDWQQTGKTADGALAESQHQSQQLDALREGIERAAREANVVAPHNPITCYHRRVVSSAPRLTWEQMRESAANRLRTRGVDLSAANLDELLDPDEAMRIERRYMGGFELSANLDRYDVLAAIAAGLVAATVDWLVVRIPKDMLYMGQSQAGSPLTKWIKSLDVPHDNWLARQFKTAFDSVDGFTAKDHRYHTFGHDPLIGLVVGTIDIMRGGLSAISKNGDFIFRSGKGPAQFNPFIALVCEIGHLLSDCATKMGIPPPGFSLAQILQFGKFGTNERTVADLARFMYLKGYDSRHFLTMSTSVAAAEVVLRGYFWIRRKLDDNYETQAVHMERASGASSTSAHPTFQAMALVAHIVGSAANAGKVAFYQGNPLQVNYAQWLRFVHAAMSFVGTKLRSPSDVLIGHGKANLIELDESWPTIDVDALEFPTLVVGSRTGA